MRGPSLAAYYPRRPPGIKELQKAYPELDIINEEEEDRLEAIKMYATPTIQGKQQMWLTSAQFESERKRSTKEEANERG